MEQFVEYLFVFFFDGEQLLKDADKIFPDDLAR